MKRILFIATCNIGKRTGGGLANLAYYNAFKEMYPNMVDLAMAEEYCIGTYANSIKIPRRKCVKKILDLLRGETHRNKSFFINYIPQVAEKYSYCIINGGIYAGDMIDIFHKYGIQVIVIHHNFEREYHLGAKSWKTFWGINTYIVNRIERNAYYKSDLNCFLTLDDRRLFHKYYGDCKGKEYLLGVFDYSPTVFDYSKKEKIFTTQNIIISGSMNSKQTVTGIMDFKKHYYDIFENKFSDWNIIITGREPSPKIVQFCNEHPDRLILVPNPSVIDKVIEKGAIFLCPTNVGGGLKLRLMDALKLGIPVLTHKVSARGYEAFWNYPFFQVYQDETSFIKGLKVLTEYIQNGENFQSEIIRIYNGNFSFVSGCHRVVEAMSSLSSD